jgi:hypothetical protein
MRSINDVAPHPAIFSSPLSLPPPLHPKHFPQYSVLKLCPEPMLTVLMVTDESFTPIKYNKLQLLTSGLHNGSMLMFTVAAGWDHAPAPTPHRYVGQTFTYTHTYTHPPYAMNLKMTAEHTFKMSATLSTSAHCQDSSTASVSCKIIPQYILVSVVLCRR